MRHFASPAFWEAYRKLPDHVRELANKNFVLPKQDPQHPSLRLKKVGRLWSVRVGIRLLWFWIGSHSDYDALIR